MQVPFALRLRDKANHTAKYASPWKWASSRGNYSGTEIRGPAGPGRRTAFHIARPHFHPRHARPARRHQRQLDSYSGGKFDAALPLRAARRGDEFTQVQHEDHSPRRATPRGARNFQHLARKYASSDGRPRRRPDSFHSEGRAVLVSPAVEKFLGAPADQILAATPRKFSRRTSACAAYSFEGESLLPIEESEIELAGGPRTAGRATSASPFTPCRRPNRTRPDAFGALVTLRDLESRERIGTELETSERLSALTRITAGVAHEVKNPLNSMRLWLENLKENLPPERTVSTKRCACSIAKLTASTASSNVFWISQACRNARGRYSLAPLLIAFSKLRSRKLTAQIKSGYTSGGRRASRSRRFRIAAPGRAESCAECRAGHARWRPLNHFSGAPSEVAVFWSAIPAKEFRRNIVRACSNYSSLRARAVAGWVSPPHFALCSFTMVR